MNINKFRHDLGYFLNCNLDMIGANKNHPKLSTKLIEIIEYDLNENNETNCIVPYMCSVLYNTCSGCLFKKSNLHKLYSLIENTFINCKNYSKSERYSSL